MASCFFRRSLSTLALATAAVCGLVANAQAQVQLKWKFQPGQKFDLQLAQDMTITMAFQGQAINQKIRMGMDLLWDVKDVNPEGIATINQQFTRIRMNLDSPVGKIEIDTNNQQHEGPAAQIAEQLRPLVGATVTQKMDPTGKVIEAMLDEKAKEALAGNPQVQQMLGENGVKDLFAQSMATLPSKPVNVGDTWKVKSSSKNQFGAVELDADYTYQGMAEHNGKQMAKLGIKGTMNMAKDPMEQQVKLGIKDSDITGTAWFDVEAGRLADTSLQQKMNMTMEAGGQTLEPAITTDMKLQIKSAQ